MLSNLETLSLLADQIKTYQQKDAPNKLTNLGLFRDYIEILLEKDERFVKTNANFMARLLHPHTNGGIPLEVYAYTKETNVKLHEHIQAELIEHLIAIMPQFDLKLMKED